MNVGTMPYLKLRTQGRRKETEKKVMKTIFLLCRPKEIRRWNLMILMYCFVDAQPFAVYEYNIYF